MSADRLRTAAGPRWRWLRFSLAGLLFLIFCASGFLAGQYYGYGVGYREGKDSRSSEDTFIVTYDVSDLITMSPPGPRYVANPDGGGFGGPIAVEPPPSDAQPEPNFDAFTDMIIETVQRGAWADVGGPGSIREYVHPDGRNMIVVSQNAFVHDEIARLLADLRKDAAAPAASDES